MSKLWRHKWLNMSSLMFDETLWQESEGNQVSARMKFALILYHVLLLHQGPITKLSLIMPNLRGCSEIDHMIHFLSKNGVEEFTFQIGEQYKLPSSLFVCLKLKHLSLYSCLINPPPNFKGFNMLTGLELCDVTISVETLGSLISSSPLLEQLVLHVSNKFDSLEIDAPMLKLFELSCFTKSICFKKSPLLAIVSLAAYDDVYEDFPEDGNCNFIEFFDSISAIQKVSMDYYFMKVLAADQVQTTLKTTLIHLNILNLSRVCLDILEEFSWVLCLIRSSPNLEEIKLEIYPCATADTNPVLDFLKVQDYSDVLLNRLQKVKLICISGTVSEMALIKLLLEKSPKLKTMMILPRSKKVAVNEVRILKELNKFWRASPIAEVNYEDPGGSKV